MALVRFWLHTEPADDLDDLVEQAAQASWLENRFFRNLARVFGAKD